MATRPKRPRDPFQLAKLIGDISTGQVEDEDPNAGKDPAAVLRGRSGGLKGGQARATALSSGKRRQIAQKAANARWTKKQ
jgi:hypothetical protein